MARKAFLLLLCVVCLAAGGCSSGVSIKNDHRPIEDVVSEAEQLVKGKAYAAAERQYAIAILKEPSVGRHYFRRSELLERIDKDKEAYKNYKKALEMIPGDDPLRLKIMHRLALINANHLFKIEEAENLLQQMPEKSLERYDTSAFLYYQSHQYQQAIKLLNKALESVQSADMKALLLYHAALIYLKTKDKKNLFGSLYYSINNAEHLGLIRDIEQLWEEINADPKNRSFLYPNP